MMRSLVISIFLYACKPWILNADKEKRIRALEMRYFRKLLGITYHDRIMNEEVNKQVQSAIRLCTDLLTLVKQSKLKWYSHATRSSGLAKTIMQGTVQGGRRRGKQRKRWHDSIKGRTGLELRDTLRRPGHREGWRVW
ncbi:endonuclease-reverse transcriptase [Plakobranchus ocellatus]|uniref:Endonuclease-reverse transcriptase n=1 Tax=Plakobranchus ocellatus TaxID=259542 RepID=A0AAV4DXW6_9GAST|nr:endonuclease-reverse transcriptase [Plakobranchus ocellatus]